MVTAVSAIIVPNPNSPIAPPKELSTYKILEHEMELIERRINDRRQYDFSVAAFGVGFVERRKADRRGVDRLRVVIRKIFDLDMEDTITDELKDRVLAPVLNKIRSGEFDKL